MWKHGIPCQRCWCVLVRLRGHHRWSHTTVHPHHGTYMWSLPIARQVGWTPSNGSTLGDSNSCGREQCGTHSWQMVVHLIFHIRGVVGAAGCGVTSHTRPYAFGTINAYGGRIRGSICQGQRVSNDMWCSVYRLLDAGTTAWTYTKLM